jgi:hypothetical protein
MRVKINLALVMLTVFVTLFALFLTGLVAPPAFADPTDACALLTPAQVGSGVGLSMKPGTHPTPTFLRTCTWEPSGGPTATIKYVTFYLQSTDSYDAAKRMLSSGNMKETQVSGIGDDAYYSTVGPVTSLIGKGNAAFKVAVYATLPPDKKETIEKALALQALSKF